MSIKDSAKRIYHFLSPRHQTISLDYQVDMKPRQGWESGNPFLNTVIEKNRNQYAENLNRILLHADGLKGIDLRCEPGKNISPAWLNGYFPGLDTVVLYGMLAEMKPKKYLEIGSGNSTLVARKAIRDHSLDTIITSVDPFPRTAIEESADRIIRKPLEQVENAGELVKELNEGDILFIDNSHRSFPNSDVTVCFLELIPALKPGVIVQIHDIYLPYDYPQFMCDRAYNEQYLLATLLLSNPNRYETIMPNFFVSEDEKLSRILTPFWESLPSSEIERHGGSYWFRVKP